MIAALNPAIDTEQIASWLPVIALMPMTFFEDV